MTMRRALSPQCSRVTRIGSGQAGARSRSAHSTASTPFLARQFLEPEIGLVAGTELRRR